jgi:hypothetical protein
VKRFLVLLVVLALVLVAAWRFLPSNAAVVNGSGITKHALNDDLAVITNPNNAGFLCLLTGELTGTPVTFNAEGSGGSTRTSGSSPTVAASVTSDWLTLMIENELYSQKVADQGLTVDADALSLAKTEFAAEVNNAAASCTTLTGVSAAQSGTTVLSGLPSSFTHEQQMALADRSLLYAHAAGFGLSAAELSRFYQTHHDAVATLCVNETEVSTTAEAQAIKTAVAAGTPFAQAVPSGSLQNSCFPVTSQNYAVVSEQFKGKSVGAVSDPLMTTDETGATAYVVLQLTSKKVPAFSASLLSSLSEAVISAGQAKAGKEVAAGLARAEISIDPQYGTVRPHTVTLSLPITPPAVFVLNPLANKPAIQRPVSPSTTPNSGTAVGGAS